MKNRKKQNKGRQKKKLLGKLMKDKYLPTEILTEILARLPVKTLLKFRCVCKSWCSIIDSPDFIPMHLSLYNNNCEKTHILLISKYWISRYELSISRSDICAKNVRFKVPNTFSVVLSNTIDGLILLGSSESRELRLWNPSIRKSLLLPACPLLPYSTVRYDLGFSPSQNDYKVFSFPIDDLEWSIAVYSLRDHVWRIKQFPEGRFSRGTMDAFYSKGVLYWIHNLNGFHGETQLIKFQCDVEEFFYVEWPSDGKDMLRFVFLYGESLAIFDISRISSCIWVLEKDVKKDSWRQRFQGGSSSAGYNLFQHWKCSRSTLLYVEKSGTFFGCNGTDLRSYKITNHLIQHLEKFDHTTYLDTYVESLVGPKSQTLASHGRNGV